VLTAISAMIRLQPDVLVARISDKMNSISETISLECRHCSHLIPEVQDITHVTIEETSPEEKYNLINDLYQFLVLSQSPIESLVGSLRYWSIDEISNGGQTWVLSASYRCPSWLSNRVWNARYLRETSGWKFHLQTHPVLPRDHDIFVFSRTGNITGLRRMLVESKSYVAVTPDSGCTPLHVSAGETAKIKVLTMLTNIGCNTRRSA
jgi:hypothetical protein